jgi:hypothetical protein
LSKVHEERYEMRSIALAICLLLGMAGSAMGQAIANMSRTGDLALTYHEVHSNAPPGGGCGCFYLSGGGLSGSYRMNSRLAIVAEFSVDHTSKALAASQSLTLTSYMAGARYMLLSKSNSHWSATRQNPIQAIRKLHRARNGRGSVENKIRYSVCGWLQFMPEDCDDYAV